MAKAFICDKCGEAYQDTSYREVCIGGVWIKETVTTEKMVGPLKVFSGERIKARSFDLCPKCTDEVIGLVTGQKE